MTDRASAELLLPEFLGNRFAGTTLSAPADLVESGAIAVLDVLPVTDDVDDRVSWSEVEMHDDERVVALVGEASDHLAGEDLTAGLAQGGELRASCVLSDEEFAAATAKLLS